MNNNPKHKLSSSDIEQLIDTAVLAGMHDILERDNHYILVDMHEPTERKRITKEDIQSAYDATLQGTTPYKQLNNTMRRALTLSDEGGFDDCGHADCIAYDAILQIAAHGEIIIG